MVSISAELPAIPYSPRTRRFTWVAGVYFVWLILVGVAFNAGWLGMQDRELWTIGISTLVLNLAFYFFSHSITARSWQDPNSTVFHVAPGALTNAALIAVAAPEIRPAILYFTVAFFLVAVPAASRRGLLGLGIVTLAAVAMSTRNATAAEAFSFTVLAALMLLGSLTAARVKRISRRLQTEIERLEAGQEKLQRLIAQDPITGTVKHQQLLATLKVEKSRVDRYGGSLSVCMFSLDDFFSKSKQHGVAVGEQMLREFAQRIANRIRMVDMFGFSDSASSNLGIVAAEMFILILPATNLKGAQLCANRIATAVSNFPFRTADGTLYGRTSVGVAEYKTGEKIEKLLGRAEQALQLFKPKKTKDQSKPESAGSQPVRA